MARKERETKQSKAKAAFGTVFKRGQAAFNRLSEKNFWFTNRVPFEYKVVTHEEMDRELRDHVDEVLNSVKASRWSLSFYPAIASTGTPVFGSMILLTLACEVPLAWYTSNLPGSEGLTKDFGERRGLKDWSAEGVGLKHIFFPYLHAKQKTVELGKVIKRIQAKGRNPFGERTDAEELLKRFSDGVIDNRGNVFLLRHPKDTAKGKTFLKMLAWNQPFQRPRFKTNPVETKPPAWLSRFNPKKKTNGVVKAVVPVKLD